MVNFPILYFFNKIISNGGDAPWRYVLYRPRSTLLVHQYKVDENPHTERNETVDCKCEPLLVNTLLVVFNLLGSVYSVASILSLSLYAFIFGYILSKLCYIHLFRESCYISRFFSLIHSFENSSPVYDFRSLARCRAICNFCTLIHWP